MRWRNTSEGKAKYKYKYKYKYRCKYKIPKEDISYFLHLRWGDWASGPKHQHHFKAITVRNRFTPSVIVPKEEKEEVEEEEVVEEEEEEESKDVEPVVHHDEEEEEEPAEEDLIVPTSSKESFGEDDFKIYNGTEFVLSNGNSTDEVVRTKFDLMSILGLLVKC